MSAATKVVIAGGSGALGRRICENLVDRGYDVVVLTRTPRPGGLGRQVQWDGRTAGDWAAELAGASVINLAGALVDRPPTPANVELLTKSRVEPTLALIEAADRLGVRPDVWIQMSTLAIYGDAGDGVLDESARPADGPAQMPGVARPWEEAAVGVQAGRMITLRTAVVFDGKNPAMRRLTMLVKLGLGGRIGTGRQWVSWLHVADFQAIIRTCLLDGQLAGIVHATSPNPVINAELMSELRRTLHRPPALPTPKWVLTAGTALLRSDPALALTGRRCVPGRLLAAGFEFSYPELGPALRDLLGSR
jgi:uncharacterized protein (TIGR01777 family)